MLEIAIVGIGCRFPGGVSGPGEFWDFLLAKGDGMIEVPEDRWNLDKFYDPDPEMPGRMYTRRGGFLTHSLWDFDPEYFGIAPREAAIMDPQQRLLLEVSAEALDDAGLAAGIGNRQVGVYVGGFMTDNLVARHAPEARTAISNHTATSGTYTMLSNRLSFVFDIHGPSMTIDTACSSSLVAIHEAAQAIARGECDLALAGGVNALLRPETFISMCKGRFLSADGRSKSFDASADGYARGEGAGVIVLKSLEAARRDGDRVYAVIRATGANQDGRTSGITVPNAVAQEELARRVLRESGVDAADIGYVEAHGTGTAVGDPVEISAIGAVYGDVPGRSEDLVVGSVKAGIGHLEAASGVAGVIKAALTVHNRMIAPQAWLKNLNPDIPFAENRIRIPIDAEALPETAGASAVAVNSFGYGGTNAHVVLTSAAADVETPVEPMPVRVPHAVFPVSGRTDAAARAVAARYADLIEAAGAECVADPAWIDRIQSAAWARRTHHPFRAAFGYEGPEELAARLRAFADGEGKAATRTLVQAGTQPVFVFSGMGPQWWGMGRDLLAADGVFAETMREIDTVFQEISGWSIVEALLADEEESTVTSTAVAQPANFAVQVALAAELAACGVTPAAIVGHSVGEVSAAYVSGALSLRDALLVSYHRARLQATTAGTGGMLAVGLAEAEVQNWLAEYPGVGVAAVNSPTSATVAGDDAQLAELNTRLTEAGVFARALRVEVPYHSHLMDPILDEVIAVLAEIRPRASRIPLYSSVTGDAVTGADWGAEYWADNVRQPVRFADAAETIIGDGHRVFLEVGPHPVLGGNLRELVVRSGETAAVVPTLVRKQDDHASLRATLAELYVAGALNTSVSPGAGGRVEHIDLPFYPWQRTHLWTEPEQSRDDRLGATVLPMLGEATESAGEEWEAELAVSSLPWLPDHVVDGLVLLPGSAMLDAALSAASTRTTADVQALADVRFQMPRVIDEHDAPVLRTSVDRATGRFTIESRRATENAWITNTVGRIVDGVFRPGDSVFALGPEAREVDAARFYRELDQRGLSYGPAFQRVRSILVEGDSILARVDNSDLHETEHLVHPATTDAALQCVAALLVFGGGESVGGPVVPFSIDSVRRHGPLAAELQVLVRRHPDEQLRADIAVADAEGTIALELIGVEFRPVRPEPSTLKQLDDLFYELVWEDLSSTDTDADVNVAEAETENAERTADLEDARAEAAVIVDLGEDTPLAAEVASATPGSCLIRLAEGEQAVRNAVVAAAAGGTAPVVVVGVVGEGDGTLEERSIETASSVLALGVALQPLVDDGSPLSRDTALAAAVLTRSAFGVDGQPERVDLAHAAGIGIRRTLRNEQPDLRWRHVDAQDDTAVERIAAELFTLAHLRDDDADEVVLRADSRYVARMLRTLGEHLERRELAAPLADPEASYVVEAPASGVLRDLALREVPRAEPTDRQIEVRVLTAGLNYKDPLKVMGLLTERELTGTYFGTDLGMETIAVVVRVGAGVTEYRPGDRLTVSARGCLRRYLTLDLDTGGFSAPLPDSWAEVAAGSSVPFLTAHQALVNAARLRAGETLLIHGAAGGVGLAAIQVAKRLGARVFGTASSPERRQAVLDAGADAAFDSRSLNFVEEVKLLTDGRGVEVVLNSAPGELIAANLRVADEFGRIVEIGKSDIYGDRVLPLGQFDRNLSFIALDIDRMIQFRRDDIMVLIREVGELFTSGEYIPLPTTVYPASQAAEAFEATMRGTHSGRVALSFDEEEPWVRPAAATPIRSASTYLITGGFGAFGLATARWLADAGAEHLVLVGRRGATTDEALAAVAELRGRGVEVICRSADISDADQVKDLIDDTLEQLPPLRGVFHAAGVLDDRPFAQIDRDSLARVFAPKAIGGWNLHAALDGVQLDHFVLYSSVAGITGNVAQASYAAANTMLDGLARVRQFQGLPAVSMNWGSLGGGMASSSDEVTRSLELMGLTPVDMDLAARTLEECLEMPVSQVGVLDVDWARWAATHPLTAGTARVSVQVQAATADASDASALQVQLMALPEGQRTEVVAYMVADQLAVVLGLPAESIDLDTPLSDLGMDSLMAVEMSARVNMALGVEVSAFEFTRGAGLLGLADRILAHLDPVGQSDAQASAPAAETVGV